MWLMTNKRTTDDIFSLFPDGLCCICEFTGDTDSLRLKIDCDILSELSDLKYSFFYVELVQIHNLELVLWASPSELQPVRLTEVKDIFVKEFVLCTTRLKQDFVEIICTCQESDEECVISLACEYISVFDQRMKEITFGQLRNIFRNYGLDF